MKSIKKIKESSKAVAGTALLVGATLAGGAAFATASSHGGSSGSSGMTGTLSDYPHNMLDDGVVDTTIVMGADAKATDVVAATNIAGQLGNDAFSTETQTVSVSGSGGSWSAANGQTLDTTNDQLYYGSPIDDVRDTLTEDQLNILETTEAFSGDQDQEVEQYLYVGNQNVNFGQPGDLDDEDPQLYVDVPETIDTTDETEYLYKLQANFEDGVEFTDDSNDDDNNRNDDVYGEDISMFGMDFTVSDDSFQGSHTGQLVLYGSQEVTSVASGESTTITIEGEEHTFEVIGVTGTDTAAVRIDGDLEQYNENDEETLSGQTVRVDNIIQTNADNSQGVVQFAMGSEQIILEDGSEVMIGEDEEDVDGTDVALETNGNSDVGTGLQVELSSVEIAFGAPDNDENYVAAGETFDNEVFTDLVFRFGGLNPNSADADAEGVSPVEYATDSDDTATVSIEDGEDSADIPFVYDTDGVDNAGGEALQPDEDENFVVVEGQTVSQDDYVVSDAGDFSHVWEVTNIDRDSTGSNIVSDDEATIELEDVVTGASVEVDLDAQEGAAVDFDDDDEYYAGTEVIDGQTYNFALEGDSSGDNDDFGAGNSDAQFKMTWDSTASTNTGNNAIGVDTGDRVSVYSAADTGSDAAVAFTEQVSGPGSIANGDSVTLEMPSTESTDARSLTASVSDSGGDETLTLSNSAGSSATLTGGTANAADDAFVTVGDVDYMVDYSGLEGTSTGSVSIDNIGVADTQTSNNAFGSTPNDIDGDGDGNEVLGPASITIQPEDDNDREHAFIVEPVNDHDDDEELDVGGGDAGHYYTAGSTNNLFQELESDDDTEVGYTVYGTYVERDTDEPGTVNLHVPTGQSTAGAAFTSDAGELNAEGGGSGSVDTMSPTGWSTQYVALDSDSSVSQAKQDSNMILVGGPAANSLVSELAEANKTQSVMDYTEGQGMLQVVEDAFSEGNDALIVAGYSGEDTRQAGAYLTNYEQHADMLAGQDMVSINTAEGSVVQ
jgi:hypothetical protein